MTRRGHGTCNTYASMRALFFLAIFYYDSGSQTDLVLRACLLYMYKMLTELCTPLFSIFLPKNWCA